MLLTDSINSSISLKENALTSCVDDSANAVDVANITLKKNLFMRRFLNTKTPFITSNTGLQSYQKVQKIAMPCLGDINYDGFRITTIFYWC